MRQGEYRKQLIVFLFAMSAILSLARPSAAEQLDPEWLRTKTEWVALRGGGGSNTFASLHVITLRWQYLYWDVARAALSGGMIFEGFTMYWGGTAVGFPWHLGDSGRHEIRVGVVAGVGAGYTGGNFVVTEIDGHKTGVGEDLYPWFIWGPELYFVWHFDKYGAFLFGVDFQHAPWVGDESQDNIYLSGFFGIAI